MCNGLIAVRRLVSFLVKIVSVSRRIVVRCTVYVHEFRIPDKQSSFYRKARNVISVSLIFRAAARPIVVRYRRDGTADTAIVKPHGDDCASGVMSVRVAHTPVQLTRRLVQAFFFWLFFPILFSFPKYPEICREMLVFTYYNFAHSVWPPIFHRVSRQTVITASLHLYKYRWYCISICTLDPLRISVLAFLPFYHSTRVVALVLSLTVVSSLLLVGT